MGQHVDGDGCSTVQPGKLYTDSPARAGWRAPDRTWDAAPSIRVEQTPLPGVWVFTPEIQRDDRGEQLAWFTDPVFQQQVGARMPFAQANISVSVAGALRGIHAAQAPPGQAKYVTCIQGAAFDVAVDLRRGSPTYGQWTSVLLDDESRRAIYLPEGIGHAFLALDDDTTMLYLCSTPYTPEREFDINPFDHALSIAWPTMDRHGRPLQYTLSEKDRRAPDLAEVHAAGLLPTVDACQVTLAARCE